ncbi:MAG: hypothetical protein PWR03_837 [Tenuifilum sp.]|jgi:hypothetical protein|uniref:glycosyltransferase family 39 protein n=1 Tax=Tenuifilum sp. TaxID=2760880 RepID=UPI0024AA67AF|nr:glycosyltransferase family 39 protein [Tenuifilum sp.]MDI3526654.1 hypothetical protein [Tenuifilum sp.]
MQNKIFNGTLILILAFGIVLRFYNLFSIPFTYDEFSAIFRTNFSNFSDLIKYGVKVDGHPAGIQVFLFYWIRLFGVNEWIVKFPFLLFGVFSIYLTYLNGRIWLNNTAAFLASAFIATLQYTVIYSQIARPYVSGLFFVLAMFYYWSLIVKGENKKEWSVYFLYVLFTSLCLYNHYFSFLQASIIGVYGLLIIPKERRVGYFIANAIALLLFTPHLGIFLNHLSIGGVGGWLGKPNWNFFIHYLLYAFGYSTILFLFVIAVFFYGIVKNRNNEKEKLVMFSVFALLPFIIGFVYSVLVNPVLQYSVLIFSFPFLLYFLFANVDELKPTIRFILVSFVLIINTLVLIFVRKHYEIFYKSGLEHIVSDAKIIKDYKGFYLIDLHPGIARYYFKKLDIDSTMFINLRNLKTRCEFEKICKENLKQGGIYIGCCSEIEPEYLNLLTSYYHRVVWQKNYHGATTYFLDTSRVEEKVISILNFEDRIPNEWTKVNNDYIIKETLNPINKVYNITENVEWGPTFCSQFRIPKEFRNGFIDVSIKVKCSDEEKLDEIILVSEIEGFHISNWRGRSAKDFSCIVGENGWINIYNTAKIPELKILNKKVKLKIYLWNKGNQMFLIDDLKIKIRKGNPIIYGLLEEV